MTVHHRRQLRVQDGPLHCYSVRLQPSIGLNSRQKAIHAYLLLRTEGEAAQTLLVHLM